MAEEIKKTNEEKDNFISWYHNKLNEDEMSTQTATAMAQPAPQVQKFDLSGMLPSYCGNGDKMKVALANLASDLGQALMNYFIYVKAESTEGADGAVAPTTADVKNCYVSPEDFKNDDMLGAYTTAIKNGIEQKYNKTISELFTNIGMFIDNAMTQYTKTR